MKTPTQAFFIKLGSGGRWESECLKKGIMRIGFHEISHELCALGKWSEVKKIYADAGWRTTEAGRYAGELRRFYEASSETIWITFSGRKLWWGKSSGSVYPSSGKNKERRVAGGWNSKDKNGKILDTESVSSRLSQVTRYQGTICQIKEFDYLIRKLNGEALPIVDSARTAKRNLESAVIPLIQNLTWKDYELLVDLVFTAAGWRRLSVRGKTEKAIDLDMMQPVTQERAMIQVKASCDVAVANKIASDSVALNQYDRVYLVTHSFHGSVEEVESDDRFQIMDLKRFSRLVVDSGLTDWLLERTE